MTYKLSLILIMLGFSIAMLISCGSAPKQNEQGKTIFEQKCALCHGVDGDKQLSGAKKLSESTANIDDIILLVTEGRNQMLPFKGRLTSEEIKAVSEYALTFQTK